MKTQNIINSKSVLDITTGITYHSMTEAAQALNVHVSSISLAVNGKSKSCKGHQFRYVDKALNVPQKINGRSKPVIDVTTGTIYASAAEAAKAFGVHHSAIGYAANGKIKTVKNHVFRFVNDTTTVPVDIQTESKAYMEMKKEYILNKHNFSTNGNCKPVFNITEGKFYDSVFEAALDLKVSESAISLAICNKTHTCQGRRLCLVSDMPKHMTEIGNTIRHHYLKATEYDHILAKQKEIEDTKKEHARLKASCEKLAKQLAHETELLAKQEAKLHELEANQTK